VTLDEACKGNGKMKEVQVLKEDKIEGVMDKIM
jgi:hypothetical protein